MTANVKFTLSVTVGDDTVDVDVEAEVEHNPVGRAIVHGDIDVLNVTGACEPSPWNAWWYESEQQGVLLEALRARLEDPANPWELIDTRI